MESLRQYFRIDFNPMLVSTHRAFWYDSQTDPSISFCVKSVSCVEIQIFRIE